MIIPIRCFSCNAHIGHLWREWCRTYHTEKAGSDLDRFEKLRLRRNCCRRMLLQHVNFIENFIDENDNYIRQQSSLVKLFDINSINDCTGEEKMHERDGTGDECESKTTSIRRTIDLKTPYLNKSVHIPKTQRTEQFRFFEPREKMVVVETPKPKHVTSNDAEPESGVIMKNRIFVCIKNENETFTELLTSHLCSDPKVTVAGAMTRHPKDKNVVVKLGSASGTSALDRLSIANGNCIEQIKRLRQILAEAETREK